MRWMVLLLVAAAVAGCLDRDPEADRPLEDAEPAQAGWVESPDWAVRAIFGDEDPEAQDRIPQHDHRDAAVHRDRSTPNFEVLGWDPLVTEHHGTGAGTYYCGDASLDPERTYAVAASFSTSTAIVVLDVTDPAAPEKVGELTLPNTHVYDAAITPDGRHAVLATSPLSALHATAEGPPVASRGPTWTTPCGEVSSGPEENLPLGGGIVLVDLLDPTEPTVADYFPQPAMGAHSVSTEQVDGVTWVAASTTNLAYQASYFSFLTLEEGPLGARFALQGVHHANYVHPGTGRLAEDPTYLPTTNGHVDATIQQHPVTGDVLAYLANWDGGMTVVRLDGAGVVTYVGGWGAWDPERGQQMTGQIHSVYPLPGLRDGRHLTVTGQEIIGRPEGRATGEVVLVDTTDPTDPRPVARWTLPVDVQWSGLTFSTHYVTMVGDTLFVSLYHGGVWAADANETNWPELPSVGVFLPDREPPSPPRVRTEAPYVQQVAALPGGDLLVFDANSGAYTVRFHPDDPRVPAAAPWVHDAWIGS